MLGRYGTRTLFYESRTKEQITEMVKRKRNDMFFKIIWMLKLRETYWIERNM